jgi:hypothetical protein
MAEIFGTCNQLVAIGVRRPAAQAAALMEVELRA